MDKGEKTRQAILERAAQIFSLSGYMGTSIENLMQVTGLTKGGIYNHFGSKEALTLEAFDYAQHKVEQRFSEMIQGAGGAIDRLLAVVSIFRSLIYEPLFPGGCLLLNTAIETDDADPVLRERARQAASSWQSYIIRTVQRGIERQQIQPTTDPLRVATLLISTLEGAVMLCKLHSTKTYMDQVVDYLTGYLHSLALS
ncbi:MAG TPA: TetR/AcrR family transcriptional regulator [Ktedonobacteraceae bacterium]|nr:TetR/AcrR family transcriptional regulator [Ktedonobacteraceae bacterium]